MRYLISMTNDHQLEVEADNIDQAAQAACAAYPDADVIGWRLLPEAEEETTEEEAGEEEAEAE